MGWRDQITKVLAGKPGGPHPGGIHVYHSSPHDFDKFDWSKLRTGEGANVYGSGFYFAENPAVSGQGGEYWNQFLNRFSGPEEEAAQILKYTGFDRAKAIELLNKRAGRKEVSDPSSLADQVNEVYANTTRKAAGLLERGQPVGPRTYEVNINARPELMLDWDKPIGQQQPLRNALTDVAWQRSKVSPDALDMYHALKSGGDTPAGYNVDRIGGGDYYKALKNRWDEQDVSKTMADVGIPGIRYLDQGSRISSPKQIEAIRENIAHREALLADKPNDPTNTKWLNEYRDMLKRAENPSYNYVVTDPSKLDILAKYGVVGGAPVGMGALAAQDQYR